MMVKFVPETSAPDVLPKIREVPTKTSAAVTSATALVWTTVLVRLNLFTFTYSFALSDGWNIDCLMPAGWPGREC